MSKTLEERFWAKVDKSSTCWNWTAYTTPLGYGQIRSAGLGILAHRLSYELAHGPIPAGRVIDHTCHNRACVNPAHLRVVTQKQNTENREKQQANNQHSGVRGVSRHGKGWQIRVGHQGKVYRNGTYPTIAEAEAAAIELRNRLHTHNDADRR